MTNPTTLLRALIIYAICVPLALILGYVLAGPFNYTFVGVLGVIVLVLVLPWLLRHHHALMVLGWNMTLIVFFLPGAPQVWLPLVAVSLLMSVIQRAIDQNARFISVPSLTWPLLMIAVVVLVTAEATGGIKVRSLGGEVYGGKRYIFLLGAIAGYFALTARRIPREQAGLYVGLFFLGGLTRLMGDVFYVDYRALQFLFWFFPPNLAYGYSETGTLTRYEGVGFTSWTIICFMLTKYGIRNIFSANRPWRLAFFIAFNITMFLGGYRYLFIATFLAFSLQFYLEGLHRTRLLPIVLVGVMLVAAVSIPFVQKFPYGVQRALSFLPIPVESRVLVDAESSAEWRLKIWQAVLPQVPQYLLLGKGLALTRGDFEYGIQQQALRMTAFSEEENWASLSGDYHNGPISLLIPFGIWGTAAFLWFVSAAIHVLYRNYRYGDPGLRIINTGLLVIFVVHLLLFVFIFGGFHNDLVHFVGWLGLSVSLNGGVASRVPKPVPDTAQTTSMETMLPRPRSAFGRSS